MTECTNESGFLLVYIFVIPIGESAKIISSMYKKIFNIQDTNDPLMMAARLEDKFVRGNNCNNPFSRDGYMFRYCNRWRMLRNLCSHNASWGDVLIHYVELTNAAEELRDYSRNDKLGLDMSKVMSEIKSINESLGLCPEPIVINPEKKKNKKKKNKKQAKKQAKNKPVAQPSLEVLLGLAPGHE